MFKEELKAAIKELASYTMTSPDGEAGVTTVIIPRWIYVDDMEIRIPKRIALEISGMEGDNDCRMGSVYKDEPVARSTGFVWIIEQTWRANV